MSHDHCVLFVLFYFPLQKKAEYIKRTTQILKDKYNYDIPNDMKGLVSRTRNDSPHTLTPSHPHTLTDFPSRHRAKDVSPDNGRGVEQRHRHRRGYACPPNLAPSRLDEEADQEP